MCIYMRTHIHTQIHTCLYSPMCFLHHLKVRLNDNARLLLPRGATLSAAGLLVSSGSEVGCDDDIYINKKGLTLTLLSSSLEVGCVADLFSPYIYIYIYMYIYMSQVSWAIFNQIARFWKKADLIVTAMWQLQLGDSLRYQLTSSDIRSPL